MPIHKSIFTGGKNRDLAQDLVPNNSYTSAENITITEENGFMVVSNMKGTEIKSQVLDSGGYSEVNIMALTSATFLHEAGDNEKCLVIFFAYKDLSDDIFFSIGAYRRSNDSYHTLYTEQLPSDSNILKDSLSLQRFGENNKDFIYFTSHSLGYFRLECFFPSVITNNFLTKDDLRIKKEYPSGFPVLQSITEGEGNLLCGTYQASFRLVNEGNNKATQWSLLTNPVHVSKTIESSTEAKRIDYGRLGETSGKGITFQTSISTEDISKYTHIEWALVENIEEIYQTSSTARRYSPIPLPLVAGNVSFLVRSNSDAESSIMSVDEMVTENAAIDSFKTISIAMNRMIAGNVKYKKLTYDRGTPTVSNSSDIKIKEYTYTTPLDGGNAGGGDPDILTVEVGFVDDLGFVRENAAQVLLNFIDYYEGGSPIIESGGKPYSINFALNSVITQNDLDQLSGLEEYIRATVTVYDGEDNTGTVIGSTLFDSTNVPATLNVSTTFDDTQAVGNYIYVEVHFEGTEPIYG